jgi:hypothetical protein
VPVDRKRFTSADIGPLLRLAARRVVVTLDLRRTITDVEVTNPRRSTSHEPNEPPNPQTTEGV